jgi:hypothetical protein
MFSFPKESSQIPEIKQNTSLKGTAYTFLEVVSFPSVMTL